MCGHRAASQARGAGVGGPHRPRPPGLHDGPHDGNRMVRKLAGQPGGLHVPGDGAGGGKDLRLFGGKGPRRGDQRSGPDVEAQAGEIAGHQFGRGKATWWRPVGGPKLGSHDQSPRRQAGVQTPRDARKRHRRPGRQRLPHAHPGRARLLHSDAGEHDAPTYRLGLATHGRQDGEISHGPTPARTVRAPSPGRPGGRGGS